MAVSKKVTKKKAKTKNKGGRPSKLDSLDLNQVKKLAKKGWTDAEMSEFFGVSETTWNNWKKKKASFFRRLKDWKAEYDARIERSLAERADGYVTFEDRIVGPPHNPQVIRVYKQHPPDTTACMYWLQNRLPGEWKDRRHHHHSGPDGGAIPVTRIEIVPGGQNGKG